MILHVRYMNYLPKQFIWEVEKSEDIYIGDTHIKHWSKDHSHPLIQKDAVVIQVTLKQQIML